MSLMKLDPRLNLQASRKPEDIEANYKAAQEQYAELGVDTDEALRRLGEIPISLHCWQGDDVGGLRGRRPTKSAAAWRSRATTRARPARRTNCGPTSNMALSLIPGTHRFNLHASYAETGGRRVERNELQPDHFQGLDRLGRERRIGMDFNPTFFAHPKADDGFTLSHPDAGIRQFWIEHGIACRRIGAAIGEALGTPCVTNVWIPDGCKDLPVDRLGPRQRLAESLDAIFAEPLTAIAQPGRRRMQAVRHRFGELRRRLARVLPGLRHHAAEAALPGCRTLSSDRSHLRQDLVRADVRRPIAAARQPRRPLGQRPRGDPDRRTAGDRPGTGRGGYLDRVHIGLDFFDASINRVAAWVIGTRAMIKALLLALLEPIELLRQLEADGDFTARLALLEELKTLPVGAVWDYYCLQSRCPRRTGLAGRTCERVMKREVAESADLRTRRRKQRRS